MINPYNVARRQGVAGAKQLRCRKTISLNWTWQRGGARFNVPVSTQTLQVWTRCIRTV